jgi:hypothetical protein
LVVVASLFTLSVAGASWSAPGDVSLVSPAPAKGGVPQSAISADGRLVAFTCDVGQGYWQVLVRDMVTGETTLVSRASGPTGAEGNDGSADPSISADGRFVAFDSEASNLSPGDHDDDEDVFVRGLRAQTTTLISRASGTNAPRATTRTLAPTRPVPRSRPTGGSSPSIPTPATHPATTVAALPTYSYVISVHTSRPSSAAPAAAAIRFETAGVAFSSLPARPMPSLKRHEDHVRGSRRSAGRGPQRGASNDCLRGRSHRAHRQTVRGADAHRGLLRLTK